MLYIENFLLFVQHRHVFLLSDNMHNNSSICKHRKYCIFFNIWQCRQTEILRLINLFFCPFQKQCATLDSYNVADHKHVMRNRESFDIYISWACECSVKIGWMYEVNLWHSGNKLQKYVFARIDLIRSFFHRFGMNTHFVLKNKYKHKILIQNKCSS